MRTTTQIATTALVLLGMAAAAPADEAPAKQWVWLARQGVWGYGYRIEDGPHRGLWRIDPGSKRAPEDLAPTPAADPYGFAAILNQYRASVGLHPLEYDPDLSAWAVRNNEHQAGRGLGHHVNPNCHQNCAFNTPDAASTADQWIGSRGHRANLLAPAARSFGIAYGPGPYWTLNLR